MRPYRSKFKAMAYKTEELEVKALEVIQKNMLVFIDEVAVFLGIDRQTFYNHNLDKFDTIKAALNKNRVTLKAGLRKKWYDGDNPGTQTALYKLCATDEERKALSMQYIDANVTENQKQVHSLFPTLEELNGETGDK